MAVTALLLRFAAQSKCFLFFTEGFIVRKILAGVAITLFFV